MMEIRKQIDGEKMTLEVEGRMDTVTAPQLEEVISNELSDVKELVLDFGKLEYLSSAGLRVILSAQKLMAKQGSMKICHVNNTIMEIFEITGFADILTIE